MSRAGGGTLRVGVDKADVADNDPICGVHNSRSFGSSGAKPSSLNHTDTTSLDLTRQVSTRAAANNKPYKTDFFCSLMSRPWGNLSSRERFDRYPGHLCKTRADSGSGPPEHDSRESSRVM